MKRDDSPLDIFHKTAKKEDKVPETIKTIVDKQMNQSMSLMADMKEMKAKIDAEMDRVISASGFTEKQVWEFLENDRNYSQQQWEKAQSELKTLSEQIASAVGSEPQDVSDIQIQGTKDQRRGKFTGARRKWLSTR